MRKENNQEALSVHPFYCVCIICNLFSRTKYTERLKWLKKNSLMPITPTRVRNREKERKEERERKRERWKGRREERERERGARKWCWWCWWWWALFGVTEPNCLRSSRLSSSLSASVSHSRPESHYERAQIEYIYRYKKGKRGRGERDGTCELRVSAPLMGRK